MQVTQEHTLRCSCFVGNRMASWGHDPLHRVCEFRANSLQKWSSWWAMNASLSPGPYTAVQYGNMHTRPGPSPHGRPDCACGGDAADDGSGFTCAVKRAWAAGSRHSTTWLCLQSICTPRSVKRIRVRKYMQPTHTYIWQSITHLSQARTGSGWPQFEYGPWCACALIIHTTSYSCIHILFTCERLLSSVCPPDVLSKITAFSECLGAVGALHTY